jgi:hypothetical protein
MGIARSLCRTPAVVVVLVFLACVGISTWGFVHVVSPKIDSFLDRIAHGYDRYLPQITIHNGHASIKEKQPFVVSALKKEGTFAVIDTRPGKEQEALNYLKRVRRGLVLTRDNLVVKNPQQVRIFALKNLPDVVLDSKSLRTMKDRYFPDVLKIGTILLGFYFLVAKVLQILVLALIPYFGARFSANAVTYGEALKVATIAMVPPVVLDLFADSFHMGLGRYIWPYLGLYLVLLVVAAWDLAQGKAERTDMSTPINP